MLSRREIDREFVAIYEELVSLSKSLAFKYKKKHEARAIVNEAYLYLVSKEEELTELKNVRIYAIKFIRDGLKWTNSSINKKAEIVTRSKDVRLEDFEKPEKDKADGGDDQLLFKSIRIDRELAKRYIDKTNELEEKIETERRETTYKVLVSHYKREVKDPVLRRLIEVYAEKKIDTVRQMADFYGMSKDSAAIEIRGLIADVRQFAQEKGYI